MAEDYTKKLKGLLRTLFQFDSTDLDFGIYRIMNQKRNEVEKFINEDLINAVEKELEKCGAPEKSAQSLLSLAKTEIQALTLDSFGGATKEISGTDIIKEDAEYEDGEATFEQHKAEIFSHIYHFFSRYYDSGDFISLQRYSKQQKYAIPYNGEEVMLHWANKDQYFIKTGKNFQNYTFKDDGKTYTMHFRISNAQVEQNNNKNENRFFLLKNKTKIENEDGMEALESLSYDPENKELTIYFEYRGLNKEEEKEYGSRNTQERILDATEVRILAGITDLGLEKVLTKPIDENKNLLRKHLNRYVQENNTDYFIHRDLKGFLTRELDFYIKNEIFNLDDILESGNEAKMERYVGRVKVFKTICLKIIDFLTQIEEFQKKLFEKKKFVLTSEYCMTVDNVPEFLYPEVLQNKSQLEEWEKLYGIGVENQKSLSDFESRIIDLKANPYLVIDTKLFDQSFKDRLLASFDDLDEAAGGLMINSENWQALNLLQNKYAEKVKCVYLDPPYNTGNDGFAYKDNYQSSSWLSMIEQTALKIVPILDDTGSFFISCDEHEFLNLGQLLIKLFGDNNYVETITWNKRVPKNDKGIGNIHEYIYVFKKNRQLSRSLDLKFIMKKDGLDEIYDLVKKAKKQDISLSETQKKLKEFYKKQGYDRGITLYCELDPNYEIWGKINMSWPNPNTEGPRYEVINPITHKPVPIPKKGWRWKEETFRREENNGPTYKLPDGSMMKGHIWYAPSENTQPSSITYLHEVESFLLRSILSLKSDGSLIVEEMGLPGTVDYPKPAKLIEWLFYSVSEKHGYFADFFAGSGTIGHSILNLNKEDNGNRKYILAEMGNHFDTVLKCRIQKVMYSSDWKGGKPQSKDGQSHIFKYLRLEQYEETLNNIEFREKGSVQRRLDGFSDYMLHYMLDFETSGSPCRLNVSKLKDPFIYTLKVSDGAELQEQVVDLVETFNYLMGIHVKKVKSFKNKGTYYRVVYGFKVQVEDEKNENIIAVWRCTEELDLKEDKSFIEGTILPEMGSASKVYINSDFAVEGALPIEPTFSRLMGA